MSKEPREFWIEIGGETLGGRYEPDSIYLKATRDTVHVIEYSAYETLTAKVKRYEEALKFYADILSWTHLKGENDFPWGRPVILYEDCGHVYPDNEWCSYGGKRARAALNQGEESK